VCKFKKLRPPSTSQKKRDESDFRFGKKNKKLAHDSTNTPVLLQVEHQFTYPKMTKFNEARLGDRINTFFTKELKKDSIDNIKEKKMHGRYETLLF